MSSPVGDKCKSWMDVSHSRFIRGGFSLTHSFLSLSLGTAKLAEQAERFDEMVTDMKDVARQPQELTVEERNLLSVAYKNVIGSRRASWRVVTSIEQKGDADKMAIIKDYKAK